jgi:hypothetical protein
MQIDLAVVGGQPAGVKNLSQPWDGNIGLLAAPIGSTLVGQSSANQANAQAQVTLAGAAGLTTYLTGFVITVGGATAAAQVLATITGLLGGTMTLPVSVPGVATSADQPIVVSGLNIPASAVNTAIVLTLPALGVGNTAAAVSLFGYQK